MEIQIKAIAEPRRSISPSTEYAQKPVATVIQDVIRVRFSKAAATSIGLARSFHCSLRYREGCAKAVVNMVVDPRWHCPEHKSLRMIRKQLDSHFTFSGERKAVMR